MFAVHLVIVSALLISPGLSHRFNVKNSQTNPVFGRSSTHEPRPEPSRWSEVVLVKMHYDCSGRLLRREVSDIQTKGNIIKDDFKDKYLPSGVLKGLEGETRFKLSNGWDENIPLEYGTQHFDKHFTNQRNFLNTNNKKELDNEFTFDETVNNKILEENDQIDQVVQQKNPLREKSGSKESKRYAAEFTRSQPGRFRKPPPKRLLVNIADTPLSTTVAPSSSTSSTLTSTTSKSSVPDGFRDDRLIDSPIIPCPVGQNFDLSGRCKQQFLDN